MTRRVVLIGLLVGGVVVTDHVRVASTAASAAASGPVILTGAGSTFDAPFFTKAFSAYHDRHHVTVTYQAVGSGTGIQQFIAGTVNFGASDVPMNSTELGAARKQGGAVEQIPIALGGVAVGYHLSGIKSGLRLSGPVLADIFLGRITNWDDPAIAALNPGVKLPNFGISVIHRADSSGTSYIFTDYLSRVSSAWKAQVGTGKIVSWPVGIEGQGNDGVAGYLQLLQGGITYLELSYVLQFHATDAALKNPAGHFVLPSQRSVAAAAAAMPSISPTHFSIVDAPGTQSYPISGYSWTVVHAHSAKARALATLMRWLATTGQRYAAQLDYVSLPTAIQSLAIHQLANVH
jgi:phosphate transport system substrate-binding protein